MRRFHEIEGLRAWLAWSVVISHIAGETNIYAHGIGPLLVRVGSLSVLTFIIISGFVITHLIIEGGEPYPRYIFRRFMRIAPLFGVTCVLGYLAADMHAHALTVVDWAKEPDFLAAPALAGIAQSIHKHIFAHVFGALTMLQGVVPSNVIPFELYGFNSPSWSVSLEWQFYLVAPLVVGLLYSKRAITLFVVCAIAAVAFSAGLLGTFENPSILPAAAAYFAIGIVSRIALTRINPPRALALGALALLSACNLSFLPITLWGWAYLNISSGKSSPALGSPIPVFLGSRSYSTYLCHFPVMGIVISLWVQIAPHASKTETALFLIAAVIPATIALSEVLYRAVERPGIALGTRFVSATYRPPLVAK